MTPEEKAAQIVDGFVGNEYWIDRESAIAAVADAIRAPAASDAHAELAALRDEVRRLREALAEIHRIAMASYTPADATELHEAILPTLRAALEVRG